MLLMGEKNKGLYFRNTTKEKTKTVGLHFLLQVRLSDFTWICSFQESREGDCHPYIKSYRLPQAGSARRQRGLPDSAQPPFLPSTPAEHAGVS